MHGGESVVIRSSSAFEDGGVESGIPGVLSAHSPR